MALNKSPMIKNPNSMMKVSQMTGMRPADAMRHMVNIHNNKSASAKEEQKKRQEARLAELEANTPQ